MDASQASNTVSLVHAVVYHHKQIVYQLNVKEMTINIALPLTVLQPAGILP